jgi:predicted transcriptional regulator
MKLPPINGPQKRKLYEDGYYYGYQVGVIQKNNISPLRHPPIDTDQLDFNDGFTEGHKDGKFQQTFYSKMDSNPQFDLATYSTVNKERKLRMATNFLKDRCNSLRESQEVLANMRENHLKPNTMNYSTIISRFCHNTDDARTILNQMKQNQVEPNTNTYNIIINKCCKTYDEAMQFLAEMIAKNISHDVITYTSIIKSCRSFYEAETILTKIEKEKIKVDKALYDSIINKCCKTYAEAMHILNKMIDKNISPDVITYSSIIKFCSSSSEVNNTLEHMKKQGIAADAMICGRIRFMFPDSTLQSQNF